jgi:hypothetical protein
MKTDQCHVLAVFVGFQRKGVMANAGKWQTFRVRYTNPVILARVLLLYFLSSQAEMQ